MNKLVSLILEEVKKFEVIEVTGIYIKGRSDFHEVPVYQTNNRDYPLTWEIKASQAKYSGMATVDSAYVKD